MGKAIPNAPPSVERAKGQYVPLNTYELPRGNDRHYQQQFADMYFTRLALLKPAVEQHAQDAWKDFEVAGEKASRVDRVLDVRQGQLCWVVGTIYMEMPLKPNVLNDLAKEEWIAAPVVRDKYMSDWSVDQVMLEDESGRLRLTGEVLKSSILVTGCIVAAMGTENANGDFEVVDVKVPDLAPQPDRWEKTESKETKASSHTSDSYVAIVSGLQIGSDGADPLALDILQEFLTGEAASDAQSDLAAKISRLLIVGNSLSHGSPVPPREEAATKKSGTKRYGYDASTYDAGPVDELDEFLAGLLPSLPITLCPGAHDPASVSLPQQALHPALFPRSRYYAQITAPDETSRTNWFDSVSNPWQGEINGWRFLITGGQPVDDVYKYVDGEDRLAMMEQILRWRIAAPTAPDTLWSYPYQTRDAFVMSECPHVYCVGNQPRGGTSTIEDANGQKVKIVSVPGFRETGQLLLMNLETLAVEIIQLDVGDEA